MNRLPAASRKFHPAGASLAFSLRGREDRPLAQGALRGAVVSGLAAIYFSSQYASRFPQGTVIFPWQFPSWAIAPFVATGLLLCTCVILRPAMFWSLVVGTAVLTAGMFVLRFPIFDEWLLGWLAAGGVIATSFGAVPRRRRSRNQRWEIVFLMYSLHLILSSLIGLLVHHNPKAIRFTFTYLVVLVLGWLLAKYDFPRPSVQDITRLVAKSSLAYYVLYIVHGLAIRPSWEPEIMEGIGYAGSGNQTALGIVAAPAALILIGRERGRRKALGWAVLILSLVVTALGDSRAGLLAIVGAMVVAPFAIGVRTVLKTAAVGVAASVAIGVALFGRPQWGWDITTALMNSLNIEGGTSSLEYYGRTVTAGQGDSGRFLYVRAAAGFVLHNPVGGLTGAGTYGYFPTIGGYLQNVGDKSEIPILSTTINYASSLGGIVEPPRPPALGALIVETGLLGIALLGICCGFAISSAVFRRSQARELAILWGPNILVATSVFLALAWISFGEIQDMILFYLLIMPGGLVQIWGQMNQQGRSPAPLPSRLRAPWSRSSGDSVSRSAANTRFSGPR